jgi:hypothetical protein
MKSTGTISSASYFFTLSACFVLMASGLLKLLTVVHKHVILDASAPVFSDFSWRELLVVTGILELVTASLVFLNSKRRTSLLLILWICLIFFTFRTGARLSGYVGPCHCLGFLGQWLGFSQKTLDMASLGALLYLSVGSCLFLTVEYLRSRAPVAAIGVFIFLAAVGDSRADTLVITGDQRVSVQTAAGTVIVQSNSFKVETAGTNWSMETLWKPPYAAKAYYCFVDGTAFIATSDVLGTNIGGGGSKALQSCFNPPPRPSECCLLHCWTETEGKLHWGSQICRCRSCCRDIRPCGCIIGKPTGFPKPRSCSSRSISRRTLTA